MVPSEILIDMNHLIRARWRTEKKTAEAHETEMRNGVRRQQNLNL